MKEYEVLATYFIRNAGKQNRKYLKMCSGEENEPEILIYENKYYLNIVSADIYFFLEMKKYFVRQSCTTWVALELCGWKYILNLTWEDVIVSETAKEYVKMYAIGDSQNFFLIYFVFPHKIYFFNMFWVSNSSFDSLIQNIKVQQGRIMEQYSQ